MTLEGKTEVLKPADYRALGSKERRPAVISITMTRLGVGA